jgi:hypothetical protein
MKRRRMSPKYPEGQNVQQVERANVPVQDTQFPLAASNWNSSRCSRFVIAADWIKGLGVQVSLRTVWGKNCAKKIPSDSLYVITLEEFRQQL